MRRAEQRRSQFRARHDESYADEYTAQTAVIAKQIRGREKALSCVLQPGENSVLGYWDAITMLALAYTAILTPYEASFIAPTHGRQVWRDSWYIINRILDVIFSLDMLLQFFVAYEDKDERGGQLWVVDRRRIARQYLRVRVPKKISPYAPHLTRPPSASVRAHI